MGQWKQKFDANWRIPYIGGWCEGYVEGAWGQATLPRQDKNGNWYTSGVHASATAAWLANRGNHPGELPPKGKTVPVFFSLGSTSLGHVAIHMDDGMVASSTQGGVNNPGYLHPNLEHMRSMFAQYNRGCTYLGWSEWVGNIKVLVWEETKDVVTKVTIPYTTERREDNSLDKGKEVVHQGGKNGENTKVHTITYEDGKQVSSKLKSNVTIDPITEIIRVGTYEAPPEPAPIEPQPDPVPVEPVDPELPPTNTKNWLQLFVDWLVMLINRLRG